MMHGKIGVREHAEGNSGCTFRFGPVAAQVKDGQMTGADEFDGTIVGRAAHNQGGILPGQRALRKTRFAASTIRCSGRLALAKLRNVACKWLMSMEAATPFPETSPNRKSNPLSDSSTSQ